MAIESQTVRERPFGLSAEGVASNAPPSRPILLQSHTRKSGSSDFFNPQNLSKANQDP
jgi:hypothetical protein